MFTSLGLFIQVACPQGEGCSLLNCLFSHSSRLKDANDSPTTTVAVHPTSRAPTLEAHPRKKLKLSESINMIGSSTSLSPDRKVSVRTSTASASSSASPSQQSPPRTDEKSTLSGSLPKASLAQGASASPPLSATKSQKIITTDKKAASQPGPSRLPPRKAPKETLNPRMLPKAPSSHATRTAILKKLHSVIVTNNQNLSQSKDHSRASLVLTPDELITMALDDEEAVAKSDPELYSNIIKLRIVKLSKMSEEAWAEEVMKHLNSRYYHVPVSSKTTSDPTRAIETGLTREQEIAVLQNLITPLNGLEEYGYVTEAPTEAEIETAKQGVADSKGWEKCDRCASRFQVFPGRRDDGILTTGGQCVYHPNRPITPPRKRTDGYTGSSESYFPCCGESIGGSVGCTKAAHHVFKISEPKRLASILQFETTPAQPEKGPLAPVCFDCEMGFTTQGLELIRLTAVSWPEGRELLDILVRPMGEILDLNSRFSGVFPEHFANAIPYGSRPVSPAAAGTAGNERHHPGPMLVVDSPAAARSLLFGFLQPETPLIGHAIDNDLNVCRIIHPTIIDTVILYPAPRGGLPSRMSLKTLTRKYLSREIQTGGDKGHDSKEDAIATGDLVRRLIADSWRSHKQYGWRFEGDRLVAPPDKDKFTRSRHGQCMVKEGC
ncbi:RNA exonuclease 3 [Penicillium diatomitis]|uniref:RNA exonuclease 3 n=1 Tax=Penicillium diatomitis TaxID=2819901 RepID=A0A9X0C061_9EURO|nr:RNA exonuclease 3 [Penicillium diatomitis]KAJ5493237.1 RNA exonuclease 3 [Penicillium diatomitis]